MPTSTRSGADELARLADAGAARFHLADNTFNLPPSYAFELCREITIGVRIYPFTALARQAVAEGVVDASEDLLHPRFYMAPAVAGWVEDAVRSRKWSTTVWL